MSNRQCSEGGIYRFYRYTILMIKANIINITSGKRLQSNFKNLSGKCYGHAASKLLNADRV